MYKHRGIITALLGVLLLLLPPEPFEYIGIPFLVAAFFLRIWARMHIGEHSRGSELACPEIVKTGPYKYINHPLYLSNFMAGVAFALFHTGFSMGTLIFCIIYAIFLIYLAKKESYFIAASLQLATPRQLRCHPSKRGEFFKDQATWLWQIAMLLLITLRKYYG
ncbi:MAG: hypothetical protein FWC15_07110 [Fibromonadales bacterium]|nr:hypothetical protein [Fibromonadales bacterium]